ncbi:MAG: transposase [Bryobacteraceae bacterium]|jgi:transposase-like protein
MGKKRRSGKQQRVYSAEFKLDAVRRMEEGESVAAICRQLGIRRWVLYRWWSAYRERGPAALNRQPGRECQTAVEAEQNRDRKAAQQIAELERKVGRQTLQIDFLQRAFKRVGELRQKSAEAGGMASTERSSE